MRLLPLLLLSLLCLASCTREGDGMVLVDGRLVPHTPDAEKTLVEQRLTRLVQRTTGGAALVSVSPAPSWELYAADRYSWRQVTVTVRLPAGPVDQRRLTEVIRDDLALQVARRDEVAVNLGETLTEAAAASQLAPMTTYTIQPGDTLAQIAALHYGSTAPWKRIIEANPGLDPGNLEPGKVITIPPAR